MDIINIQNWTNFQVLQWFKGLDESLQRYDSHLKAAEIDGGQLLSLSTEDLCNLRINLVGHQELIFDAVSLLQQLDYGLDSETLQSRALCLKCRCRGLRSTVATRRREAEEYEYDGGVSLQRGATNQLLHLASDVLDEGKQLVLWLDRAPFNSKPDFRALRDKMVQLCYELSVTMQQSVFACVIEDAALNICVEMENSADGIVQSSDPLSIQPVSLEQVHFRDVNPDEGLGLFIKATFEGHHVVTGTRKGSIASRMRKMRSGDEVIAVNGKAVIGWTLASLVAALKEQPHEVSLLIKKRPQVLSSSSSNLLALFQRNETDRSKLIRAASPVKMINTPPAPKPRNELANDAGQPLSARSSMGTWSSRKSQDPMEETSSERMTSGSDMSDQRRSTSTNESGNSSLTHQNHKSKEKLQNSSILTGSHRDRRRKIPSPRIPSIVAPQSTKEATSPIDVLKLPPPPEEPYTPTTNHLSVNQSTNSTRSSRSASPNSIMDIEHRRRYTVIGGSTVDQEWYEDFLMQVKKCNCTPSSGSQSQEKVSSNEDVFSNTPPSAHTSATSLYKSNQNFTQAQRRSKNAGRPVSMPPDYYCPVKRVDQPVNHHQSSQYSSQYHRPNSQPQDNSTVNYPLWAQSSRSSSQYYTNVQQASLNKHLEYYKDENRRSRYNNSNNNNITTSSDRKSSSSSHSSRNPPKPPPRSSSITKLSHRLSAEIRVDHSRQSSLPVQNSPLMQEEVGQNSLPKRKPAIARKPTRIRPRATNSTAPASKNVKSLSTPHLSQQRRSPEMENLSSRQLSASEDKLRSPSKSELVPKPVLSRHIEVKTSLSSDAFAESESTQSSSNHSPPKRPVPKPRKKNIEKGNSQDYDLPSRERSHSHGLLSIKSNPVLQENTRRKSADHVPQKSKIESILDSLSPHEEKDEVQKGYVRSSWKSLTPARHSPIRCVDKPALNSSIRYPSSALNTSLRSGDVPQLDDSYELKVIAGVPVRLRKSISRLANNKIKNTPEKGKSTQSSSTTEMKGERRVSCRDLGHGDCQGWLWKKKSGVDSSGSGPLTTKWAKRWVVIKGRAIYCYRTNLEDDDQRAECYISLPGYKVAPAPECKRKFAFHISHLKRKTFFFAADRQNDMSRWMNKMGLAAIEYKYEAPKQNGRKAKEDDYYSESDEESLPLDKSTNSTPERKHESVSESVNGEVRTLPRPHARTPSHSPLPNGNARTRCKSESIKGLKESSVSDIDGIAGLPPSPRKKPNVTSDQRRHRGSPLKRAAYLRMSRSLDSLMLMGASPNTDDDSIAARHRKAKELATEKAEKLKQRRLAPVSPTITVKFFDEKIPTSPLMIKRTSLSTFYYGDSVDQLSLNQTSVKQSRIYTSLSTPTLSSMESASLNTTRRDVAGRPKVTSDLSHIASTNPSSEHQEVSPTSSPKGRAAQLKAELTAEDPFDDMCKSIKKSELDLLGVSRRTTLRRKMTILSRDPLVNERMLRKRALERELKAKELELAYFDKLLSKENITPIDLHEWINQHPSLVAELGTIRRISKKKRQPLPGMNCETEPLEGDQQSSSEEDWRYSSSSERDSRLIEENSKANANNNNSNRLKALSKGGRPRSSAIGEKDFNSNVPDLLKGEGANGRSRTSSAVGRRRKIIPNRQMASRTLSDKPYLETDL